MSPGAAVSYDLDILVTAEPPVPVPAPAYRIEAVVRDGAGAVVYDRTGRRALEWPACLAELSHRDRRDFIEAAARAVVRMLAESRPPPPPKSKPTDGATGSGGGAGR